MSLYFVLLIVSYSLATFTFDSTHPDQVLLLDENPFAICDYDGQINPPGFAHDLWVAIQRKIHTDMDLVCKKDGTGFNDGVALIGADEYPASFSDFGVTSSRLEEDILYTVSYTEASTALIVPCGGTSVSSIIEIISPIWSPFSINILAVILIGHALFALIIYACEYMGSQSTRDQDIGTRSLFILFMSLLGYEIEEIKSTFARIFAFVDTLFQEVLLSLLTGSLTLEAITSNPTQLSVSTLSSYTIGVQTGSASEQIIAAYGPTLKAIAGGLDGVGQCLDYLAEGLVDGCGVFAYIVAAWNAANSDRPACISSDRVTTPFGIASVVNDKYTDFQQAINQAIAVLYEEGTLDSLKARWLSLPEASSANSVYQVAGWAWGMLIVFVCWTVLLIVRKIRTNKRRKRKGGLSTEIEYPSTRQMGTTSTGPVSI